MTEQEKYSRYDYTVAPFTDDVTGHLSWHTLGKQLLTCAGNHATEHGFGFHDVRSVRRAWVVSRLVMECHDMPVTGAPYQIETFVNRIYRQFTDRMFVVCRPGSDEPYGYGFSTWSLIDFDSRMPVALDNLEDGGFTEVLTERTIPIAGPGRVRVKSTECVARHRAAFSDLDVNGHVNSIRYIDLLLDQAVTSVEQRIRRIDIAYARESMLGDVLCIYREGNQYEIRLEDGTVLARAEIIVE